MPNSARDLNALPPSYYPLRINRWAILVGISQYQQQTLNLTYADRDAEALYAFLRTPSGGSFKADHMLKLINQQATTANITQALRTFLKKPAPEDLVLLYFSCHGSPDFERPENVYLITYDTNPNDISGTALPMREIDLSLQETLQAERVIILADTCHSGAIGGGIGRKALKKAEMLNRYLQEISASRDGIALLTSAEANEVSWEDSKWGGGHGVFTHYLLEGMKGEASGADRVVRVGQLFEYVREQVKQATNYSQHPAIGTNPFDRNLPIAILPGIDAPPEFYFIQPEYKKQPDNKLFFPTKKNHPKFAFFLGLSVITTGAVVTWCIKAFINSLSPPRCRTWAVDVVTSHPEGDNKIRWWVVNKDEPGLKTYTCPSNNCLLMNSLYKSQVWP